MKFDPNIPFSVVGRGGEKVNEVITPEQPAKPDDDKTPAVIPADDTKGKETPQDAPEPQEPETETKEDKKPEGDTEKDKKPAEEPKPEVKVKTVDEVLAEKTAGKFKTVDELLAELAKPHENKYKDDLIEKVVKYYDSTGKLEPVLRALATDWSKVSDEDLFRQDLREKYPNLSTKALEKIYQKEVVKKYNLDANPDDEDIDPDDIELGKELFKHEAQKLRDAKVQASAEFKIPERQEPDNKPDEAAIKAAKEQYLSQIATLPATQELVNNKRVVVKYDGGEFNFEVDDPAKYLEMATDTQKILNSFVTDGKADLGKFFRAMAFANNEEKFIQAMKTHFKSQGTAEVIDTLKNKKPPVENSGKAPEGEDKDFKTGLLKAFIKKGAHT